MPKSVPSTQFFTIQRYRKKMSWLIFGLFCAVVALHALVLLLVCMVIAQLGVGQMVWGWWFGSLAGLMIYLVFAYALQSHRIKNGGQSMAGYLGAIRLFYDKTGQTGDEVIFADTYIKVGKLSDFPSSYARFYEFAEQMSLASGVPCPKLYVLPNESGINGFVAGFDDHDMVMVLTQGAVERLNNEALYALIGHEFGHILHGDARLNLRLYVMMAGLSLFYECADWLEELLLGKFHANYHSNLQVDMGYAKLGQALDRSGRGRQFNTLQAWSDYQANQANFSQMPLNARTGANVMLLPIMAVLVLLRIVGVFGMESFNWLKSKFNHQRELLADATSMQLTRSFGMVALLKIIEKHDTALYTTKVSAMDYFFFANPSSETHVFNAHPATAERLTALKNHAYDELGLAIVGELDLSLLQEMHDHIARHAPVATLQDEVNLARTVAVDYHDAVLEQFVETVVDGRLITDDKWQDWGQETAKPTPIRTEIFPLLQYQLSGGLPIDERDDVLDDIKLSDLQWGLAKYLKQPLGLIALLEMVMLCRFERIDTSQEFDFYQLFVRLPNQMPQSDHEPILPHALNADSLRLMASQPRHHDVAMIVKILAVLPVAMNNLKQQFRGEMLQGAMATLNRYAMGLGVLFLQVGTANDDKGLQTDSVWQGAVLAGFCGAIGDVCQVGGGLQNIANGEHWGDFDGLTTTDNQPLDDVKKSLALLLLAILALHERPNEQLSDRQRATVGRWYRLVGIELGVGCLDKLLLRVNELSVVGWAGVFWQIGQHNTQNIQDTLHTAFLYDQKTTQKEQGILAILHQFIKQKSVNYH